jgi:hypothetical protein
MNADHDRSEGASRARLDAALERLAERPVAEVDVERALARLDAARPSSERNAKQRSGPGWLRPDLAWPVLAVPALAVAAAAAWFLLARPWGGFPPSASTTAPAAGQAQDVAVASGAAPTQASRVNAALAAWRGLEPDSDPATWPAPPELARETLIEVLHSGASESGRAAALALALEPGSSLQLERASERDDRAEHALWALARLGFEGRAPLERALLDARRGDAALAAMASWPAAWRIEAFLRGAVSPEADPDHRRALQRALLATEEGTRALLAASFDTGNAALLDELDANQAAWVQAFVAERGRFDELALLALDATGGGDLDDELTEGLVAAALDRRRRARALPMLADLRGPAAVRALVELDLSGQLSSAELETLARPLARRGFEAWATAARDVRERRELDALYQLALGFPGDGATGALLELGGRAELSAEARAWAWLGAEGALDDAALARLTELACDVERSDRQAAAAALVVLARRTGVEPTLDRFDLHARVRERVRTKLSDAMGSARPSELIGLARELRTALPLTPSPTSETLQ